MNPVPIAEQLINHKRAVVVAPAGCGKTETIVDAVALSESGRQLVLTHTNAGVDSLRKRFNCKGISKSKYKLQTIASFAAEYANAFPSTANTPAKENIGNPLYYDQVYESTAKILNTLFAKSIIKASYTGVFVDEYQDCNLKQHELVKALAEILPCRVLGDPLQGIFEFGGNKIVDWEKDVYSYFESLGELREPWRWKKTDMALGQWVMQTRLKLERDEPIEFTTLPKSVVWMCNDDKHENQRKSCLEARQRKMGSCVAIHKVPQKAHSMARNLGGVFYSAEEVEAKDLIDFCEGINLVNGQQMAIKMYEFACRCSTGVKQELSTIIKKIEKQDYNMKRISKHLDIANVLVNLAQSSSYKHCYEFLCAIEKYTAFKIFRRELWCEFKRVLNHSVNNEGSSLADVAKVFRNVSNMNKRYEYENVVSRILLIKGLEYDQAIILDADELTKKEFYVAISRPKKRLIILSKNRTLLCNNS